MKKRIIAMALVIVMLFALSACGKKQESAPAATEAPAPAATEAPAPATEAPAASAAPATAAPEEPKGIPDGSGVVTITSSGKNFSIDFDSDKYTAFENPTGGIRVFAGMDEDPPYCTVSLIDQESAADAVSYLNDLAASAKEERGKDIVTEPAEPKAINFGGREISYIFYAYQDKDAGGTINCAYYAENLDNGQIAVFNSLGLEQDSETVDAILKLAIESFKLAA